MALEAPETPSALTRALGARKVAVFGATADPRKLGHVVVSRLLRDGFRGELVLVNPSGGTAFGRPLVTADHAAGSDVAAIVTGAAAVPDVVRDCGRLGIPLACIYATGFAERGRDRLQAELRSAADRAGIRLLGPNCIGILSAAASLNLTSLPDLPRGSVGFATQSGGLVYLVGSRLAAVGAGYDFVVSLGNKVDLGFVDVVAVAGERRSTSSLLVYVEALDEGTALLDSLRSLARRMPVVGLVGGRTGAGRRAAASHTAALVPERVRLGALLEDAGVYFADSVATAVAASAGARGAPRPLERVFVLCDGGGFAVLLCDHLDAAGFDLAQPSAGLRSEIDGVLGCSGSSNPLDFAGSADRDLGVYAEVAAAVLGSGEYDALVIGGMLGGYARLNGSHLTPQENEVARRLVASTSRHEARVVVQTPFAAAASVPVGELRAAGIPCVESPEKVVAVLAAMRRPTRRPAPLLLRIEGEASLGQSVDRVLDALAGESVAEAVGRVVGEADLPSASPGLWVLRLDGIPHKSAAGAIQLGLRGSELECAYRDLVRRAAELGLLPRVRLAPFVPHDYELLVSVWRTPGGAHGLAFGTGGAALGDAGDVVAAAWPEDAPAAAELVCRTSVGRTLRDEAPARLDDIAQLVLALGRAFARLPDLVELECNPVGVGDSNVVVLDVLPTPAAARGSSA